MNISIVIAAYREPQNIGALTERLIATLDAIEGARWELIYIIDGVDETLDLARRFAEKRPEIRILHQAEPRGLGQAFRRGFAAVASDSQFVITMDADLNHQPEEIPALLAALRSRNADLVIGSRKLSGSGNQGTPVWKGALSDLVNRCMRLVMGVPVADQTSGYRIYRSEVVRRIVFINDGFAFQPEVLMRAHACGFRIVEAPIQFVFRKEGDSKMKLFSTALSYVSLFRARKSFANNASTATYPNTRRLGKDWGAR